jgi:signal transduction histidine kinase
MRETRESLHPLYTRMTAIHAAFTLGRLSLRPMYWDTILRAFEAFNRRTSVVANRWGILVASTFIFIGIMHTLFGWMGATAMLCTLVPSLITLALLDRTKTPLILTHWMGSEQNARLAALALCASFACGGALLAALFGPARGAEYGVILANGASAIVCLWFRGNDRENVSAIAPYTATYVAIIVISIFQGHFVAVAQTAGLSFFVSMVIVGCARAFAREARTLASERLHLISDLSLAEAENRMAAQRLELALEISKACVYEMRPLEQRLVRGESAAPIYGRALTWQDFTNPENLVADEDLAQVQDCFLRAFLEPSVFSIEYRIKTASGELKWVQCTARSFADEEQRIDRVLLMLTDISQRKAMESEFKESFQRAANSLHAKRDLIAAIERELLGERADDAAPAQRVIDASATFAQMSRELSDLIKESEARDATLTEAVNALRDARAAADAANAAKSQFLANMSHELRTPLNAVIGYSEIIMEDLADMGAQKLEPDVQRIRRSAEHLLSLINSVLNFSKVDAGHLELEIGDCDTAALVDEVVETLHPTADKNGLALFMEVVSAPVIQTDSMRLRQCLLNLLSNACKFTTEGSVRLRVETIENGERIAFHVIDTGIGVSPGQASRLFEPFMQADTSITRQFGGTGLGLAITRRFARALGGDVSLDSELGRGSCFTLTVATKLKQNHLGELVADEPAHRVA